MNRKQLLIGLVAIAVVAVAVAGYFVVFGTSTSETVAPASPTGIILTKNDRTLGSPRAPLTVLEYAAPTCPHCAHFDMDIFPQFKQQYIDTGKVYFIFRVFPLNAVDVAAESIARCLPEDNYFQFLDLLYRNQAKWDPDGYQIADVHAGLVEMGRVAGLSAQQVDSCIANQDEAKRIQQVGSDAQAKYGIDSTPSFVVNGQVHGPFEDFQEMRSFINLMLSKK